MLGRSPGEDNFFFTEDYHNALAESGGKLLRKSYFDPIAILVTHQCHLHEQQPQKLHLRRLCQCSFQFSPREFVGYRLR